MINTFFTTLLGFTPCWDYKTTNAILADVPGVYTSDKVLNLSTIDKFHWKCDCIQGSMQHSKRFQTTDIIQFF